jgi:DNA (cytosine-5)-methyltransferase 1
MRACRVCSMDARFVRMRQRPAYERLRPSIRIADLFAGGGGLSLGIAEAARRIGLGTEVALAVEDDAEAAQVFARNFPRANLVRSDVSEIFDGGLRARLTSREREIRHRVGELDLLLGGPPCQGHSYLNNHTRHRDPRNALYLRAARAAEVLRPTFVVLENVPSIERDVGGVVAAATAAFDGAGYRVRSAVLDLSLYGVPQLRRRHFLVASRIATFDLDLVLTRLPECASHEPRTVAWGIRDLASVRADTGLDSPTRTTPANRARMQWLIDRGEFDLPNELRPRCHHGAHSYVSMYGRLRWDAPAQTITTGFGSMGQGRFVHPSLPRTITPHEAARLQTLPDFFDLHVLTNRKGWATVIGNAVPPLLGVHLSEPLLRALPRIGTVPQKRRSRQSNGRVAATKVKPRQEAPSRNGVPRASSELIRIRMKTTKRRDTAPELALRSHLHRMGLRYAVDRPIVGTRRRADIVFRRARVAVFVDGCFWHRCPDHGTLPKRSREWWRAKLDANRKRDADTDARLRDAGWAVLRFWEHDDPATAADLVSRTVRSRATSPGPVESGRESSRAVA